MVELGKLRINKMINNNSAESWSCSAYSLTGKIVSCWLIVIVYNKSRVLKINFYKKILNYFFPGKKNKVLMGEII